MSRTALRLLLILATGLALLAVRGGTAPAQDAPPGTGASPAASPGASPIAVQEVKVEIKDLAFSPQTIEVPVGTTVTWTNEDVTQHTVVSEDKLFGSEILQKGDTFSYTFDEPGTYDYICSLHPSMKGQVIVTG
jgi:plastocyanin